MPPTTMALSHVTTHENRQCSGCGADFIPSEDSGSRLLSIRGGHDFAALLCGGCHSKWSHGSAITLKGPLSA